MQGRIGQYQSRLNLSPVAEQQLTELTRGYDQSRTDYDALLKKKNDSELATNLVRQQQGEQFRIIDPPSLPTKPFSPNRLKLCAIGLLCGLLLGTVTVAGAEIVDERIYSEKDFKKLVPAAVLAEIPSISTGEELEKHHLQARLKWIAAGLMFTVILAGSALSYFKA